MAYVPVSTSNKQALGRRSGGVAVLLFHCGLFSAGAIADSQPDLEPARTARMVAVLDLVFAECLPAVLELREVKPGSFRRYFLPPPYRTPPLEMDEIATADSRVQINLGKGEPCLYASQQDPAFNRAIFEHLRSRVIQSGGAEDVVPAVKHGVSWLLPKQDERSAQVRITLELVWRDELLVMRIRDAALPPPFSMPKEIKRNVGEPSAPPLPPAPLRPPK